MPRKIRQVIADLNRAGFIDRGGKGSHRNFSKGKFHVTISGNEGDDAKPYQERLARKAIEDSKNEKQA